MKSANHQNGKRRKLLEDARRGLLLQRLEAQEKRKSIETERIAARKVEYSNNVTKHLMVLQKQVTDLQDQVRQLQLQSDEQRLEVRALKNGVDRDKPDLSQDLAEQRLKRNENWQTFYEAGQTLREDRQDSADQLFNRLHQTKRKR